MHRAWPEWTKRQHSVQGERAWLAAALCPGQGGEDCGPWAPGCCSRLGEERGHSVAAALSYWFPALDSHGAPTHPWSTHPTPSLIGSWSFSKSPGQHQISRPQSLKPRVRPTAPPRSAQHTSLPSLEGPDPQNQPSAACWDPEQGLQASAPSLGVKAWRAVLPGPAPGSSFLKQRGPWAWTPAPALWGTQELPQGSRK